MNGKTILILGNGFDLAHSLPTRYADFLKYCKDIEFATSRNSTLCEEDIKISENLINNIWNKYFQRIYRENKIKGENWIDFESEISFIISFIDRFSENLLKTSQELIDELKSSNFEKLNIFSKYLHYPIFPCASTGTIKDIREKCFNDLEKLINALELYLLKIVEKKEIKKLNIIDNIQPDYIINFNYTHTYERRYGNTENVFHIHGECKTIKNEKMKSTNMVLGVDEYWSEEECDNHTNYAIFKKFVQRIRKKTGTKHIEWLNEINEFYQTNKKIRISNIYIFGHSLDITDKDILKGFFTSEATRVHIYCKDVETEGELIANVIKLMGEKKLLEKVNQASPKIEFITP